VHPEVIALGVRIGDIRETNPLYFLQQGGIGQNGLTQFSPIPPATA
jgi:hypothetical protein